MKIKRTTFVAACLALCATQSIAPAFAISHTSAQIGLASWYGKSHQGRKTANGERFDRFEMTAAHRSLPFNTLVRVTALASGREVTVRITDRGPHVRGRIIDLSEQAAGELGIRDGGVARVRIEPVELPG